MILPAFVKDGLVWAWKKTPWYVKGIFAFIVIPNFIFNVFVFFFWFLPWQTEKIHATIIPYQEKRDTQIERIILKQDFQNKTTNDTLARVEQHLSMFFAEAIKRNER